MTKSNIISVLFVHLLMHILILGITHHPCLISDAKQCLNSIQHGYITYDRGNRVRYYVNLFICDLIFTCRLYLG